MRPIELLLVEDGAGDTLLITQALRGAPVTVNVHIARDGEQAVSMLLARHFNPDIVIPDLGIPRINGIQLLERFRHLQLPPVVVFSATTSVPEIRKAVDLGASDFVQKPTDLTSYKKAVVQMIIRWCLPETERKDVT
jgi:two-component system chemotaxis response regulator CheB